MDEQLRQDWIRALRSGAYIRTVGTLRDCQGYCVMGVLANIVSPGSWDYCSFASSYTWKGNQTLLPFSTRRQVGISFELQTRLVGMNDEGATFQELANFIESPEFTEVLEQSEKAIHSLPSEADEIIDFVDLEYGDEEEYCLEND